MPNHYETLGVSKTATDDEIKKAYRKLSLQCHPDRAKQNGGTDTTSEFQAIGAAYEILSDAEKRREYDFEQSGQGHPFGQGNPFGQGHPFGGFPFGGMQMHHGGPPDMNNIFEQFFRGGGMEAHFEGMGGMGGGHNIRIFHNGRPVSMKPQKPSPLEKHISISLEQAFNGIQISMELEKRTSANTIEKQTIIVPIPKGIDTGECVVLPEMGNCGEGGLKGDIHLFIKIEPHPLFTRNKLNLHCKRTIELKEALCGFFVEINHVNGKMLRLNNQNNLNIIKPGYQKEVAGYGMIRGEETGNLFLEFEVRFPDHLTSAQMEILKATL